MRSRAALAVALVLAVGGALAVDRVRPDDPHAGALVTVGASTGTLACPIALEGSGAGYVSVANVGTEPSAVRITAIPDEGRIRAVGKSLPPGGVAGVSVHEMVKGSAGVLVEYAGGLVVASHAVAPRGAPGAAAAPCARSGAARVVVANASTARADTHLALMNPGLGEAVVDVRLVFDGRAVRPERLRGRIVPGRGRLVVDLGDHVFDQPNVAVVVEAATGRVVAEALRRAGSSSLSLLSQQEPVSRGAAVVGPGPSGALLSMVPIGPADATVEARIITAAEQGHASEVPSVATRPGPVAATVAEGSDRPAAFVLSVLDGAPVAAAARWAASGGGTGDALSVTGAAPARRWAAIARALGSRSAIEAVIVNPGTERAAVRLRLLGSGRPDRGEPATLAVGGGRLGVLRIGRDAGIFAVEVASDEPVVVAILGTATAPRFAAFAFTATPLEAPDAVRVLHDPTVGRPRRDG